MAPKCSECGLVVSAEDLEVHINEEHVGWIPYQCIQCDHVFVATENLLRDHYRTKHPGRPVKILYNPNEQRQTEAKAILAQSLLNQEKHETATDHCTQSQETIDQELPSNSSITSPVTDRREEELHSLPLPFVGDDGGESLEDSRQMDDSSSGIRYAESEEEETPSTDPPLLDSYSEEMDDAEEPNVSRKSVKLEPTETPEITPDNLSTPFNVVLSKLDQPLCRKRAAKSRATSRMSQQLSKDVSSLKTDKEGSVEADSDDDYNLTPPEIDLVSSSDGERSNDEERETPSKKRRRRSPATRQPKVELAYCQLCAEQLGLLNSKQLHRHVWTRHVKEHVYVCRHCELSWPSAVSLPDVKAHIARAHPGVTVDEVHGYIDNKDKYYVKFLRLKAACFDEQQSVSQQPRGLLSDVQLKRMFDAKWCSNCGDDTIYKFRHIYKHLNDDFDTPRYSCAVTDCQFTCYEYSQITLHAKEHQQDPLSFSDYRDNYPFIQQLLFACVQDCYPAIRSVEGLDVVKRNAEERMAYCSLCEAQLPVRRFGSKSHVYGHHMKRPVFTCNHCDYFLTTPEIGQIRRHLASKHPNETVESGWTDRRDVLMAECDRVKRLCFADDRKGDHNKGLLLETQTALLARRDCAKCGRVTPKLNLRMDHLFDHLNNDYSMSRYRCTVGNCQYTSHSFGSLSSHLRGFHRKTGAEPDLYVDNFKFVTSSDNFVQCLEQCYPIIKAEEEK